MSGWDAASLAVLWPELCLGPCIGGWAPPLQPHLGAVQKRVLNVFQDLVEELLAGLRAVQVH